MFWAWNMVWGHISYTYPFQKFPRNSYDQLHIMMILTNTILTLAYAAGSAIAFTGNVSRPSHTHTCLPMRAYHS